MPVINKTNAEHYLWGEVCEGWGRGIDTDGSLIIEADDGHARHILTGAVRMLDRGPGA